MKDKVISEDEFRLMVKELAAKNLKFRRLLESSGGYDNLSSGQKNQIDRVLKIKREVILKIIEE